MQCVFCEIVAGREPASVVYEDDDLLAFMSLLPARPGECVLIPKRHIDHFTDIPDDLAAHLMIVAQKIGRKMREVLSPNRVGMVVHGFGVAHAHLILVPQHSPDDITSGRFAHVEEGRIMFDLRHIESPGRADSDRYADMLRTI